MHLAAGIHEDDRALAHGLGMLAAVRIGARLVQEHERELVLAAELLSRRDQHGHDVGARHAKLDVGMYVPDCVDRDVARRPA